MSFSHFRRKKLLKQQKFQSRRALQKGPYEESYNYEECPSNSSLGEQLVTHEPALEEDEESESPSEKEEECDYYGLNRNGRRYRLLSTSQLLCYEGRNNEPRPDVELGQLQKETKKCPVWGLLCNECPPQGRPQTSTRARVSIQGTSRRASDGHRPSTSAPQEGDFCGREGCGVGGQDSRPSRRCEQNSNVLRWLSQNRAQWNGCKDNSDAKKAQGRKQRLYEGIVQLKEINRKLMKDYREILWLVEINRQFIELYEAEKQAKREARKRAEQLETLMEIRSQLMGEKNQERTDPEVEVSKGARKKHRGGKQVPCRGKVKSRSFKGGGPESSSTSTSENHDLVNSNNLDNYGRDWRNRQGNELSSQNSLGITVENQEGLHRNEGKTYKGKSLKKIENRRDEVRVNHNDCQTKTGGGKRTTERRASEVQVDNRSTNNIEQGSDLEVPLASTSNNFSKKFVLLPVRSGSDGIMINSANSSRIDDIVEDRDKKISGNALPKKSTPDPEKSKVVYTWNLSPFQFAPQFNSGN